MNLTYFFNSNSSNTDEFTLMCKNIKVLYVNKEEDKLEIFNSNLLPFYLRRDNLKITDVYNWLNSRAFNIGRTNAKKIMNALKLSQNNSEDYWKYCNALSVTDCYWIQFNDLEKDWSEINLYENELSKSVAEIAINGNSIKIPSKVKTPEVTTLGVFPKCWIRKNGKLFLYKGFQDVRIKETDIEILVSDLLDILEVSHIKYWKEDNYSVCENMTNTDLSICPIREYLEYCKHNNINITESLSNFKNDFTNMIVIDYLINNFDRHDYNWGIYYNPNTGKEISLHPLFDHNNSLIPESYEDNCLGNLQSLVYPDLTLKEAAYKFRQSAKLNINSLMLWLKDIRTIKRFQDIFELNEFDEFNDIVYKSLLRRVNTLI